MLKPFPHFASDEEAEEFVDTADLSEYDWSTLRPVQITFSADTGLSVVDAPEDGRTLPSPGQTWVFAPSEPAVSDRPAAIRTAQSGRLLR